MTSATSFAFWPSAKQNEPRPRAKMPAMQPPMPKRATSWRPPSRSDPCPPPHIRPAPRSIGPYWIPSDEHSKESSAVPPAQIDTIPTSALVQPTALPPAICRTSKTFFQASLQNWDQAKLHFQQWLSDLILQIGTSSQIFVEFGNQPTYGTVIRQLLSHVGPSTLDLYSRSVNSMVIWMKQFGTSWSDLTLQQMVSIIHFAQEAARSDVQAVRIQPPQLLRGLRWLAKTALMQQLMDILNNYLMGSFLKGPGKPKDRKEAVPVPFSVLVQWEMAILSEDTSDWLILLLGGFLLAVWASLRFADLQRTELSSLSLAQSALRGTCRLMKRTRSGQPFGIFLPGFLAMNPHQCWVVKWLRVLQRAYHRSLPFRPDFVIPTLNNYVDPSFSAPLSYTAALKALRWASQTPWAKPALSPASAHNLTLHSLKVTLLSAAAQLRLPAQARQLQGHHLGGSVQLYSRDDTVDALWLQRQISLETRQGWRPMRPLQRGGQQPAPEPAFSLPFASLPDEFDIPWESRLSMFQLDTSKLDYVALDVDMHDEDSDSDTLSSCSSSSSTSLDLANRVAEETIFIQNGPAGCCHVAMEAPLAVGDLKTFEHLSKTWKPCCGVSLKHSAKAISLEDIKWPCKRAACRLRFDSITPP